MAGRIQSKGNMMAEKPILFNGAMIKAILAGTKLQTRRVIKNIPDGYHPERFQDRITREVVWCAISDKDPHMTAVHHRNVFKCPYGVPGDLLWVRETLIRWCEPMSLDYPYYAADTTPVIQNKYANVSDGIRLSWSWKGNTRPSIFMPKWACRLWLKVKSVRVERIQEISENDAICEGTQGGGGHPDFWVGAFRDLWDSINKDRGYGWDVNPWCWKITFEKLEKTP